MTEAEVFTEQSLLGRIMVDPLALDDAAKLCEPQTFYEPLHGRIFNTVLELHAAGGKVSPVNVRERMNGDPGLKTMRRESALRPYGGDYIAFLAASASVLNTVEQQAATMKAGAARRATLHALGHTPGEGDTGRTFTIRRAIDAASAPLATDYLIKKLVAPGDFSVWYGPPGCGKSFAVLHACAGICAGRAVFGRRVRAAPVLYVCLEGETNFAKRVQALTKHWGGDAFGEAPDAFCYIAERADFYEADTDIDGVILAALSVSARLVVIDTLARVLGAGSENEGRDMARMISCFDRIKRETGAHVCVIHHTGKDDTRGMRGHSNLLAAADTTVEIKRDEEGGRTLRVAKAKDDEEGEPQAFTLKVVEVGTDEDGEPITSCVVAESGAVKTVERGAQLSDADKGWLRDLQAVFDAHNGGEWLSPCVSFPSVQCLTREQVREGLKGKGRFDLDANGNLTAADRTRQLTALNRLKDKRQLAMTAKHVWLLRARESHVRAA